MLSVRGLSAFYGLSRVVDGVTLSVAEGEAVALLGRNGAGKTSLLRALAGLVRRQCGEFLLAGRDVSSLPPHRLSQAGLILVPDYRGVLGGLTVGENLAIATRRGSPFQIADALKMFPRLRQRLPTSGAALSGGEQQMLAIARGLMCNPRMLLLDEPTEGLAPQIIDEITGALLGLLRRDGHLSVLLADQRVDTCLDLASRHYLLDRGVIGRSATSEEIRRNPSLLERFLGVGAVAQAEGHPA